MDEKTLSQLKRSINHEHIYWQHRLLAHHLNSDKFADFEYSFAENMLDYQALYPQLLAVELEVKVERILHLEVSNHVSLKYGLQ